MMRQIAGNGYEIHYAGGRLADVMIDGTAIECVQVRESCNQHMYGCDCVPVPTDNEIRESVRKFLAEAGGLSVYLENCLILGDMIGGI